MTQIYELGISIGDETEGFSIEHRFPGMPAVETIVALRDEALRIYEALFPADTSDPLIGIALYFIPRDERETVDTPDRAPTS